MYKILSKSYITLKVTSEFYFKNLKTKGELQRMFTANNGKNSNNGNPPQQLHIAITHFKYVHMTEECSSSILTTLNVIWLDWGRHGDFSPAAASKPSAASQACLPASSSAQIWFVAGREVNGFLQDQDKLLKTCTTPNISEHL